MSLAKKILTHKIWIFFLSLVVIIVLMAWGYREFFYDDNATFSEIVENIYLTLFSSLFTIFVIGIFFEFYLRNTNNDLEKKRLVETIQGDSLMLEMFSYSQRKQFILKNIKSIIGEKYGEQLFNSVIKKYLDGNLIYRDEYQYDVEIVELDNDININNYKISSSGYFIQNQNLISTKHFSNKLSSPKLKVIFAFDEQSLDYWLNDENVFMREILFLDNSPAFFNSLSQQDLYAFVKDTLSLKINFYDKEDNESDNISEFSVNLINTENKGVLIQGIEVSVSDSIVRKYILQKEKSRFYKAKVSFGIPLMKENNRFYFVIAEPTTNPKFTFRYPKGIKNVDYITYFAQKDDTFKINLDKRLKKYSIYSRDTIYPRSGIIFFWS
ncbi:MULTISPECIES: hypothetical protein [Maribellus]|uniref:Uncharacterized protein n=1 Tax=Maribellus comscasis TaxID=2681766 RepID=A0A6I6K5E2_9BACT|nr:MULTISPECIES: hypothetical protein [Maribellus]MCG6186378.1 hypothetical protein [Maribellus maritimus]QGY46843.1 hypothetical protein GM418_25245 [Maribellus comscasis]